MLFLLVKWLHVVSAITALGANLTYGIWIARASQQPKVLPFVLRNIKLIDDRLANPAYGLLLLTGLAMSYLGSIPLTTPWLLTALILYALMILLAAFGYTPTLKGQIRALDQDGFGSQAYKTAAGRSTLFGALLGIVVLGIVFLMVVKPPLWA